MNQLRKRENLRRMLAALHTPVSLLDRLPDGLTPADSEGFRTGNGLWCEADGLVLYSPSDTRAIRDLIRVLLISASSGEASGPTDAAGAWQYLLTEQLPLTERHSLEERFGLRDGQTRCVMVMHAEAAADLHLRTYLAEMAPLEKDEYLLTLPEGGAILLKHTEERETPQVPEDTVQFARALRETLEGETGLRMTVGISRLHNTPEGMQEGLKEAECASDIGRRLGRPDGIYVYDRLLLERFLSDVPPEVCRTYRAAFMTPAVEKLMTEEMTETVQTFFRQNLNVTDTARQLFIHRNSLIYRLDKIRRETGLDLRRFEDALIFRMMTSLPEDQSTL